jgi:hypothetical protein
MSRSAAFIWKAALENVPNLPPCPDDLNEPQWVDLVFGRNCHVRPIQCGRVLSYSNFCPFTLVLRQDYPNDEPNVRMASTRQGLFKMHSCRVS